VFFVAIVSDVFCDCLPLAPQFFRPFVSVIADRGPQGDADQTGAAKAGDDLRDVHQGLAVHDHRQDQDRVEGAVLEVAVFGEGTLLDQHDRHRAHIHGADAEADGALANYEQQVLLALEESENAFSDYGKRQRRLVSLIRQSESSRAAADLAAIRYREGTVDFLVLLDAQRERLAAEDAQAQAEVELYRGIVAIYKALGGGWQPEV